jgi:CRISPR-associated protein Cas1
VDRRRSQYFKLSDPAYAASTARSIVSGKIINMATLCARRGRDYGSGDLAASAMRLKASLPPEQELSMEKIRGYEGLATRIYFSAFSFLIRNDDFFFKGRNKRPPLDPVNTMLSYVYTVLTADVLSAIQTVGLDPYLGTLHEIAYGRPSLACDLVEEFRAAFADRLVLGLVNRKAVRPDDFIWRSPQYKVYADEEEMAANRPVEMKPIARSKLMAAYEEMMNSTVLDSVDNTKMKVRMLFLKQARTFSESLLNGAQPYRPFVWSA